MKNITEDEIKIVLARLETMPSHIKLSVGNYGMLDKNELKEKVMNAENDKIGEIIVQMYMSQIRSFKDEVYSGA